MVRNSPLKLFKQEEIMNKDPNHKDEASSPTGQLEVAPEPTNNFRPSRKKLLVVLAVIIGLAFIGGMAVYMLNPQVADAPKPITPKAKTNELVGICKTFTPEIASQILGSPAQPADISSSPKSRADTTVETCIYYNQPPSPTAAKPEDVTKLRMVSLVVITAKNDTGKKSITAVFKPGDSANQVVTGYGEKAFWKPKAGNLNVLKNGKWYIFTNSNTGAVNEPADAKKLADVLLPKLN